jgi:hypothetical protein
MDSSFASPLGPLFRREKLDTDLDLRKIAEALIEPPDTSEKPTCLYRRSLRRLQVTLSAAILRRCVSRDVRGCKVAD